MDAVGMAAPPSAPEASNASPVTNGGGGVRVENCYVFKSRLQEYAQKGGLPTPEYHTLKEGPSHEPIFKSTVVINNTSYDSLPGFFNRKAAEQSAAEVALMHIVKSMPSNANIQSVQETGLCKNLLQEYAQKMNYAIPSYICTKQASGLAPFICTVEIGGIQYIGAAARTKKEAEIKAARTALLAIQGQSEGCANGATKYIVVPGKRQVKETEKKPIETPKPLKAKKGGFKKKWNKRKFMKKNGQAVDMEKDEARVSGDVHNSDVLMQPAVITQELSSDTTMQIPDEEARIEQETPKDIAMGQSNGEARHVKEKPSNDTAILQPDEEARKVEAEPPRDTAMVQPNEEAPGARSEKQEPSIDTAMLPPNEEARSAKQEPSIDAAMLPPNEEAKSAKQVPSIDAAMLPPNEEARSAKQEPPIDTGTLRPDVEARRVEPETPRDTAILQPNIEGRSVKQGPANDTVMAQPDVEANGEVTSIKEGPASSAAIMQTANQEPPSNALSLQPKEPKFENSESLYEHENQSSGVASLEKNKAFGDMPGMDSAPSST